MLASVTFDIPQELAVRIRPLEEQVPRILELGLREFSATAKTGFTGSAEIFEFLANLPEPEEIIQLQPSEELQTRVRQLLEKNRISGLSAEEQQEWEQYEYLEHLVRIAKAKAHAKLQHSS